jgi:hypothetical protein
VSAGIYRSGDGGISWSLRPTQWLAGLPAPASTVADIALAPDDPDFVAAACMDAGGTHRREVFYSEDGGTNWHYSGPVPWLYGPGEQAGSIAISPPYPYQGSQVHDIIIGSRNPADGLAQGEIYVFRCPGISGWKAQGFMVGDIITLHPSPAYSSDSAIVVISSTLQRTYINLCQRDLAVNACSFNIEPNWPVELCTSDLAGGAGGGRRVSLRAACPCSRFQGGARDKRVIFAA